MAPSSKPMPSQGLGSWGVLALRPLALRPWLDCDRARDRGRALEMIRTSAPPSPPLSLSFLRRPEECTEEGRPRGAPPIFCCNLAVLAASFSSTPSAASSARPRASDGGSLCGSLSRLGCSLNRRHRSEVASAPRASCSGCARSVAAWSTTRSRADRGAARAAATCFFLASSQTAAALAAVNAWFTPGSDWRVHSGFGAASGGRTALVGAWKVLKEGAASGGRTFALLAARRAASCALSSPALSQTIGTTAGGALFFGSRRAGALACGRPLHTRWRSTVVAVVTRCRPGADIGVGGDPLRETLTIWHRR